MQQVDGPNHTNKSSTECREKEMRCCDALFGPDIQQVEILLQRLKREQNTYVLDKISVPILFESTFA